MSNESLQIVCGDSLRLAPIITVVNGNNTVAVGNITLIVALVK